MKKNCVGFGKRLKALLNETLSEARLNKGFNSVWRPAMMVTKTKGKEEKTETFLYFTHKLATFRRVKEINNVIKKPVM